MQRALDDLDRRLAADDWTELRPQVFVALFARMHAEVYGVEVIQDMRQAWKAALGAVGRLLREEFNGDADAMLRFIKWAWAREIDREEWRRRNNTGFTRLTWYRMFVMRELLTDWRVDIARKNGVR